MAVDFKGLAGGYRKFLLNYKIDWKSIRDLSDRYIFWACPFTVILGAIDSTETGLKPLYSVVSDYTQLQRVFQARGSVLVNWEDSYDITQQLGTSANHYYDNYGVKTFKVGYAYKGVMLREGSSTQFVSATGTSGFTAEQITDTITMRFYNIDANKKMFEDLGKQSLLLKFFILPNFNKVRQKKEEAWQTKKKKNPFFDECRTFFYAEEESTVVGYEDEDNIGYIDITFLSVNSRINKSGIAVNTYLQLGGAGEPFAFPYITTDNKIILDPARAQPVPVTHAQVQILGVSGVDAIQFVGRPVYRSNISNKVQPYKIYPPCTLNFYNLQKSIHNLASLKAYSTDVYYWVRGLALNLVKNYAYTQGYNAYYNPYQPKQVQGFITTKETNTTNTNGNFVYYDKSFIRTSASWSISEDNTWDVNGNSYFLFEDGNVYSTIEDQTKKAEFNFAKVLGTGSSAETLDNGLAHFFMFNAYLQKTQIELPLETTDLCKVDVINFPLAGSLFRRLTFGFGGSGWSSADIVRPEFSYFNCIMPKVVYTAYTNLFVDTINHFWDGVRNIKNVSQKNPNVKDGTIPFELFYNGMKDGIGLITGANAITQSFCGSLTHMLKMKLISKDNTTLSGYKNLATSEIQQDLSKVLNTGKVWTRPLLNEKTRIAPANITNDNVKYHNPSDLVVGYVIDFFELLHFSKAEYQIKFFSVHGWNPDAPHKVEDEDCVWIGTYKSQADTTGNIRLFRNYGLISDPTFNWKTQFNYPQDLLPPPPASSKIKEETVKFTMTTYTTLADVRHSQTGFESSYPLWNPSGALSTPQFVSTTPVSMLDGYDIQKIHFPKMTFKIVIDRPITLRTKNQYDPPNTITQIIYPWAPQSGIFLDILDVNFTLNDLDTFTGILTVPNTVSKTYIYRDGGGGYNYTGVAVSSWNNTVPPDAGYVYDKSQAPKTSINLKVDFSAQIIPDKAKKEYTLRMSLNNITDESGDSMLLWASSIWYVKTTFETIPPAWSNSTFDFMINGNINADDTSDLGTATYILKT